jgi:nucleotide-binding universal stress UspA family protein
MPLVEAIHAERRAALEALLRELGGSVHASSHLREGAPGAEILAQAAEISADLIVIGTHGASGFERFFVGSTTRRVLHRAACPVLTIPKAADEPGAADRERFTHVLAAVDLSASSLRALELGLDFARRDRAPVTLLHVVETLTGEEARLVAHYRVAEYVETRRRDAIAALQNLALGDARQELRIDARVELGDAARSILRVAAEVGADLLVMGAHGRSALGAAIFGSATNSVVAHATCPVLTARG